MNGLKKQQIFRHVDHPHSCDPSSLLFNITSCWYLINLNSSQKSRHLNNTDVYWCDLVPSLRHQGIKHTIPPPRHCSEVISVTLFILSGAERQRDHPKNDSLCPIKIEVWGFLGVLGFLSSSAYKLQEKPMQHLLGYPGWWLGQSNDWWTIESQQRYRIVWQVVRLWRHM